MGTGSSGHLNGELLLRDTGVAVPHIPYKGSAPAMQDLVAGNIQYAFENLPVALPLIQAGKLRAIGVTSAEPSPQAPDIPSLGKTIPGFEDNIWFGFIAPPGLASATAERLREHLVRAIRSDEVTKALQERIFVAANILNAKTRFIGVRYGNVLASRGSVIPLFHEQINNGGPVTITLPGMTRFLLSLNRAVDTVFAAISTGLPGEIYVPDAPSATVLDLAKALIGKRAIKIKETGIRPGEKIHEVMVSEEEANHCVKRGAFFAIKSMLPELAGARKEPNAFTGEFSSAQRILDYPQTVTLLKKHRLMVDDKSAWDDDELLR